jgi:P-type Mg2+ transporter
VTPEQKSRTIKAQRATGSTVRFLGDGVNDAVALHDADVEISVESATDVAKDAADIVLLDEDLDILAGGVVEGRRIFANTIKYVLMDPRRTSGICSAPARPRSQLPSDAADADPAQQPGLRRQRDGRSRPTISTRSSSQRPAHWNTGFIRVFMTFFGPISSIFDFATFGIMIWVFNADAPVFRSGWFVESLAT